MNMNSRRDPANGTEGVIILFHEGFGPYQPRCHFPSDCNGHRFSDRWYSQFNWLEYSPRTNKIFFRVFSRTGQMQEAFVSTGFHKWKKSL